MMVQFPEHEHGKKQADPKVVKLDKLAQMLGVSIQIDGVSYGGGKEPLKNDATVSMPSPSKKVEEVQVKTQPKVEEPVEPAPKRRGRQPKS